MSEKLAMIVEEVLAGNLDKYREIIQLFESDVYRFVVPYLASRASAEDVTQDVFIAAYEHLDRFDRRQPFRAWLLGIARNVVRQELRRRYRDDNRLELYSKYLNARQSNTESISDRDVVVALAKCRDEFTQIADEAVRKRYDDNQSIDDVAKSLGRTAVATRQLLYRARITLRDCIQRKLATVGGES